MNVSQVFARTPPADLASKFIWNFSKLIHPQNDPYFITRRSDTLPIMPLIIVTGLPSSGKSETAKFLYDQLKIRLAQENDPRHLRIVSDSDTLDWDGRDVIYMSIAKEKELRSWLRAEVQRYINLNQIVILDSSSYIKGFRYELFCTSKEAKTQYCIVERLIDKNLCWQWNEKRLAEHADESSDLDPDAPKPSYSRETFDALLLRYEACDESNRWDSPLFRITTPEDQLNIDRIFHIVTREEPLVPNKCTQTTTSSSTIYKATK